MPVGHVEVTSTTPESNREGYVVRQVGEVSPVAAAESLANPTAFQRISHGLLWNSATWDREMGNIDGTALADASRTAGTVEGADIINYNHRGAHVVIQRSTGNAHLLLTIQGKDELFDAYYNIFSGVTLSGTGTASYIVYPGVSAVAANISLGVSSTVLPRTWRVKVVPSTSPTAAYGVGYSLIR
jgi:hypothetical protein